jgi:hypothetical protein
MCLVTKSCRYYEIYCVLPICTVVKTSKAVYRNAVFFFDVILILNQNLTFNYISVFQLLDLGGIFAS